MLELQKLKAFLAEYKRQVQEEAEKMMALVLPELTEELFSQYEKTGNRLIYENVYFTRRKFLAVIGIKAILEKKENGKVTRQTLNKLIGIIHNICSEECWALPAHVNRAEEGWPNTIDLFAAETAQTLAELADRLKKDMPEDVRAQIVENVERRVLRPFFSSSGYGWENSDHNWNAVCAGSIGSACIHLRERSEETDACLKRICDSLLFYIEGFSDDGVCMEGCGYFTYGMSYFVNFAQELREYSEGRADLLSGEWGHFKKGDKDKRGRIASFQSKCFFADGRAVNFSDADSHDRFSLGLNLALKTHFDQVSIPDLKSAADLFQDPCYRFVFRKLDLFETEKYLQSVDAREEAGPGHSPGESIHLLPEAQWYIANARNGVGMACKGGHNGEAHNHNDVGHFIYGGKGIAILADLGAGEYTRDYFGENRYEILCNNSFGHSVPIINGIGQLTGSQYRCERFETSHSDDVAVIDMDLSGAYGEHTNTICRKLEFSLTHGNLRLTDTFSFAEGEWPRITENLITQIRPVLEKDRILLFCGEIKAMLVIPGIDHKGDVCVKEYSHSNHAGEHETVYAIQWEVPVSKQNSTSICELKMLV